MRATATTANGVMALGDQGLRVLDQCHSRRRNFDMIAVDTDLMKRLQDWYASQCNGDWEHTYGISLSTLDNPGWSLKVDLTNTYLSDRRFDEVNIQGSDQND